MNQLLSASLNRLRILFAVVICLFFAATLLVPFASCPLIKKKSTVSRFDAVMPKTKAAVCFCAMCAGHTKGANCCCDTGKSLVSALVYRAICDTAPDSVLTGTVFPPTLIPCAIVFHNNYPATTLHPVWVAKPLTVPDNRSPLPPDAPPRFLT